MSTEETIAKSVVDYFPLETPRPQQIRVIKAVDAAFREGKRIIILRAPVGSGKSAIAMTFANMYGQSHVITPRKSLQDQYFEDFKDDVVLMKGRNAYPCTINHQTKHSRVLSQIATGRIKPPARGEDNCSDAPCRNSEAMLRICQNKIGKCPYSAAMELAQDHHTVIHNIHSFMFQAHFGEKFQRRKLMIIDEAHEIEGVIREFITKKFVINRVTHVADRPSYKSLAEWCDYFLTEDFIPEESKYDLVKKANDPEYKSARDEYITSVELLRASSEYYGENFSVRSSSVYAAQKEIATSFEFVPHSIGDAGHRFLFDYGDKVLLMSGTIYDHAQYCRSIGVNPSEALSIDVPSSFPISNRPVYLKPEYQTDTSFACWKENFGEMIDIIDRIQNIFKDAKGLIHAPSYDAAGEIVSMVPGKRLMTHGKHDFQERLEEFYAAKDPRIFVSPVCQQGVDFKGDRARFQIITRVPYLNTSDPFVSDMMQKSFDWYNYQALVIFGQQLGRPVRSETDFGATFLLDSRFNKFVSRNRGRLPKWTMDAMVWK